MTQDRKHDIEGVETPSFPNIIGFLRTLKGYPDRVVEQAALEAAEALSERQARIEGLEKALRPFAAACEWMTAQTGDAPEWFMGAVEFFRATELSARDFLAARSALSSGEGGAQNQGDSLSRSQPSGEVSPDGEIFAGQHSEPSGASEPQRCAWGAEDCDCPLTLPHCRHLTSDGAIRRDPEDS